MEWLMEYDRTKADPKCKGCERFYKLIDDVLKEDAKNITQINKKKARVKISAKVMKDYDDDIKKEHELDSHT